MIMVLVIISLAVPLFNYVDRVHNSHRTKLLDLGKSISLRIVNSRIVDCFKQRFYSHIETPVIDQLLAKQRDFPMIKILRWLFR